MTKRGGVTQVPDCPVATPRAGFRKDSKNTEAERAAQYRTNFVVQGCPISKGWEGFCDDNREEVPNCRTRVIPMPVYLVTQNSSAPSK